MKALIDAIAIVEQMAASEWQMREFADGARVHLEYWERRDDVCQTKVDAITFLEAVCALLSAKMARIVID